MLHTIDGIDDKTHPMEIAEFWAYFGGKPESIIDEVPIPGIRKGEVSLHHISDASGKMTVEEVGKGKLDRSMLISDDAFVLDGVTRLYVWIGKGANTAEKREAMCHGIEYLERCGRGTKVPIARVMEGKEPTEFWDAFDGKIIGSGLKKKKRRRKRRG